jgi:hypothetical protein
MLYEDTLPLLALFLVTATFFFWLWRSSGQYQWAVIALIMLGVGCGVTTVDWLIETDKEQVELLLPVLARAVERKDIEAVLDAIAPEKQPVQEQAESVVRDVMPQQVLITRLEVDIQQGLVFPTAIANMLVRVTGSLGAGDMETVIVSVVVTLQKRNRWLVTRCIVEPADLVNKRKETRAGQVTR